MKTVVTRGASVILSLVLVAMLLGISCGGNITPPTPTFTAKLGATPTPLPTATPPPVKPIVMKTTSFGGATYTPRIAMERWQKLLEERSGGRIKVDYYPAESLIKMADTFRAVSQGIVQAGMHASSYEPDLMGAEAAFRNMPWNMDFYKFYDNYRKPGGLFDVTAPYWEKNGIKILSWYTGPDVGVISRKPIKTVEDWKGKLIRCTPGPSADAFKLLGAEGVFMTQGEIYEALQRGTIDGTVASPGTARSLKWYELAPYFAIDDMVITLYELIFDLNFFKSLPADLQKLVTDTALEVEQWYATAIVDDSKSHLDFLKTQPKVEIVKWSAADRQRMKQTVAPLYDQQAKKWGDEWQKIIKAAAPLAP